MTDDEALERLRRHYHTANTRKFEGILPRHYHIEWNPYLRRLTGRITYAFRLIEISTWHYRKYGYSDAVATLEHEMLHLYLHRQGLPSGHNSLFKKAAEERSIRVFHSNDYPRNTPPRDRYVYLCGSCGRMVFRQRLQNVALACGICCRAQADGAWDARFTLTLLHKVRMV